MSDSFQATSLRLAGVILPLSYIVLCVWMALQRVWWFTYIAYFFLFGICGGWCLAFAESPSGITASSIVFLISGAVGACLISSIVLQLRKKKGYFEMIAMISGYLYPLLVAGWILNAIPFFKGSQ